jgi:hypothetical protein
MRLGEIHGAGPSALDHLGQEFLFQLVIRMREDRGDRALHETRIHREGEIGRGQEFVDDHGQRAGQSLSAIFGGTGQPDPAAGDELRVGFLESRRRGDTAVGMARTSFDVACSVERSEHLGAELSCFYEHCFDHIGRRVAKSRHIVVALDVEHIVEQEHHVVCGRVIDRHRFPPESVGRLRYCVSRPRATAHDFIKKSHPDAGG